MGCKNCQKTLEDEKQKFCSIDCQNSFVQNVVDRLDDALKNDSSHTEKFNNI